MSSAVAPPSTKERFFAVFQTPEYNALMLFGAKDVEIRPAPPNRLARAGDCFALVATKAEGNKVAYLCTGCVRLVRHFPTSYNTLGSANFKYKHGIDLDDTSNPVYGKAKLHAWVVNSPVIFDPPVVLTGGSKLAGTSVRLGGQDMSAVAAARHKACNSRITISLIDSDDD